MGESLCPPQHTQCLTDEHWLQDEDRERKEAPL